MKRQDVVITAIGVAAAAYVVHGLITETGLAGWLNYAQQSLFGSYSLKLTALIMIFGLMGLGIAAWWAMAHFGGATDDGLIERALLGPQAAPEPGKAPGAKMMWIVCAGMVVATWVIGYAVYLWQAAEQREDAAARYEPVVLADGAPLPRPAGTHISLQGRVLGDRVLSHRTGSTGREDYHLVPVVSPGWSPGQPVAYVAKVKTFYELPGQRRPAYPRRPGQPLPPPDALLARLDGAIPVPAVQEFRKMGVVLGPESKLLRVVPSNGSQPAVADSSAEDFNVFLILCGGISGLIVLSIGAVNIGIWRQRRKAERAATVRRRPA